jgi:hypothetical protein
MKADELDATDITGQGLEWLSIYYDTNLWARARNRTLLFNELVDKGMRVVTIPQGSQSMDIKLDTSSSTVYLVPEANDLDAVGRPETVIDITPFGTSNKTAAAKLHAVATGVTYQLEEDSIINVMQWLNEDMARVLQEALEDAILNGDTTTTANTNINLIDGTPASTALYLAWDGIRHNALVDNTSLAATANGALTYALYEQTLGRFPSEIMPRRNEMLFVIDWKTESATRRLPELLGRDTAGTAATIFAGDLGQVMPFGVKL